MAEKTRVGNVPDAGPMKPNRTTVHRRNVGAGCYNSTHENQASKEVSSMSGRPLSAPRDGLNHRALAMLRAVVEGRAELSCSQEPDLFVDGVPCCDQFTAHVLAHDGLIEPAYTGDVGQRVPATLTAAGLAAITEPPAA